MNKAVDLLSLLAGMIAFAAIILIRFSQISLVTATDIVIKSTLAFMVVSILSKVILGKIFKKIIVLQQMEMMEKRKIMERETAKKKAEEADKE